MKSSTFIFPKNTGYMKYLEDSKYISFVGKNEHLLIKYNSIWVKESKLMKKNFKTVQFMKTNTLELKLNIMAKKLVQTAKKMKFSIKNFSSKFDEVYSGRLSQ